MGGRGGGGGVSKHGRRGGSKHGMCGVSYLVTYYCKRWKAEWRPEIIKN